MTSPRTSLIAKLRKLLFGRKTDRIVGRTANWLAVFASLPALFAAVAAATNVARRFINHLNWNAYFDFSVLWIDRFIAAYEWLVHPIVDWLAKLVGWSLNDTQKNLVVLYFLIGGAVANTFLKATRGPHADYDKTMLTADTVFEWCGSRAIARYPLLVAMPLIWPIFFPFLLLTPLLVKSSDDDLDRKGGFFTQATNSALEPGDRVIMDFRWYFSQRLFWVTFLTLLLCVAAAIAQASD